MSIEDDVIVEYGFPIDKRVKVLSRYDCQIRDLFLYILRFYTKTRGPIKEDFFENSPVVIIRDDML